MKKILIILVLLIQFMNYQEHTKIMDQNTIRAMASDEVSDTHLSMPFVLWIEKDTTVETLQDQFEWIVERASVHDVNLRVQRSVVDSLTFEFYVYGSNFEHRNLPSDGEPLHFSDVSLNEYYSTDSEDTEAQRVYLMNPEEIATDAKGRPSKLVYTLKPFSLMYRDGALEEIIQPEIQEVTGDVQGVQENINSIVSFVSFGNSENVLAFMSDVKSHLPIDDQGFGYTQEALPMSSVDLTMNLRVITIVLVVSMAIFESKKKKIVVRGLFGFSPLTSLLKEFASICIIPMLVGVSFGVVQAIQHPHYKTQIMGRIAVTELSFLIICFFIFVMIYWISMNLTLTNYYKSRKQYEWVSAISSILKVLILMSLMPTIIANVTVLSQSGKLYLNASQTKQRFENTFTLSNELKSAPLSIVKVSEKDMMALRQDFDAMGGIHFNAGIQDELLLKSSGIDDSEVGEIPSGMWEISQYARNVVVVNTNFLDKYGLKSKNNQPINTQYRPNTVYIPQEYEESLEGRTNRFCPKGCENIIMEEDFYVDNLEVNYAPYIKQLKNPVLIVLGDAVGIEYATLRVNNTVIGSPFYNNYHFDMEMMDDVMARVAPFNTEEGAIHARYPYESIQELLETTSRALTQATVNSVILFGFVFLLAYQACLEYLNVYGKKFAIQHMFGYSVVQSVFANLLQQALLYLVPLAYILTGTYKSFSQGFQQTNFPIGITILVFLILILIDFGGTLGMYHYQIKHSVNHLKGEQL